MHDTTPAKRRPLLFLERLESRHLLAPLLPDLFAWADTGRGYLYDYAVEGDLLRFSTAMANQGAGALEIRGGAVLPSGRQEVFQRIFDDQGGYSDRLAGEFTYHPGHGHIHFDGYASYHLRAQLPGGGVGDVVASHGKISFCLIDVTRYDPQAGPSSYSSCGATRQGISAGWSDVYGRHLPDQWINIATVPDGDYYLEVVVDPDNQLHESDETNNVTRIPVTLQRGAGAGGDVYEPNNSFAEASPLGPVSYFSQPSLSIHTATDNDYFAFTAAGDGLLTARTQFAHAAGDLQLQVFDAAQQLLAESTGATDMEQATWEVTAGQTYLLRVWGEAGAVNGYSLELNGPGELVTQIVVSDDPQLPAAIADSPAANTPGNSLQVTLTGPDLVLSDVNLGLDDLRHTYLGDLSLQLTSPAGTTASILHSTFQSPSGFLGGQDNFSRTVIDDQAPQFLGTGQAPFSGSFHVNHPSVGTNPLAVFQGENAAGLWTLTVTDWYPADTGALHGWSLQFRGARTPDGDRYEPNDSFPQAVDLGTVGDVREDGLSIHTADDQDVFRFVSAAHGQLQADLLFDRGRGDLQMILYNDLLEEIARSQPANDPAQILATVARDQLYYIMVLGVDGATNDPFSLVLQGATGLAGDFNDDGTLDGIDLDLFSDALAAGLADPRFDLNGDGQTDAADGRVLVQDLMGLLLGDANLDGAVDVADFNMWNAGKYQAGRYREGDFNFDGVVDASDFNVWNAHKFAMAPPSVLGSGVSPVRSPDVPRPRRGLPADQFFAQLGLLFPA